jgi:lysozyme
MEIGEKGKDLIKQFEGLRLKAYRCSADVPTIGYGNTFYEDGIKVKIGDKVTVERANELFDTLLPSYEKIVLNKVKRDLTQNEFDALVSHTYNTGGSETLFRLVEANAPIRDIKKWWTERYITASGVKLRGLVRRRAVEFELFINNNI